MHGENRPISPHWDLQHSVHRADTRVFTSWDFSPSGRDTAPPSQPCRRPMSHPSCPASRESVPRLLLPQLGHLGTLCLCHVSRAHPHCLRLSESLGCQVHHTGCPSGKTCSDCLKIQLTNLFLMQKLMFLWSLLPPVDYKLLERKPCVTYVCLLPKPGVRGEGRYGGVC